MVSVNEAKQKIDYYIKRIVEDIILFRKKRVDASAKILGKLEELMNKTSYLYRLGELYDKVIKVEKTDVTQADISRPKIQLRYVGAKTTLTYNGYAIDVPSIPVFIYEAKKPDVVAHEAGIELLQKNTLIKLPVTVNVAEEPNIENAYGKYFNTELAGWSHDYVTVTIYAGRKLTAMGMIMSIQEIDVFQTYILQRSLTINGTSYAFAVSCKFGKVIATTTTVAGAEVSDVEYPCTFFTFSTEYSEDCSAIILGNEVTRGPLRGDVYVRDALLIYFDGTTAFFVL